MGEKERDRKIERKRQTDRQTDRQRLRQIAINKILEMCGTVRL